MRNRYKIIPVALFLILFVCIVPLRAQESEQYGVQAIAVKTNLLYDAAMIPNIGVELAFPNNWSLIGNWNYAWWSNYDKHRFWRTYGGEVEARKWFGKYADEDYFREQHCGLYIMAGTYDFEWGKTGYMNDLYFSVGVAYGYAVKIARNLSLDFVIGVGYMCGTYQKYKPEDGKYCIIDTKNLSYIGPTKAEISLVWTISDLINGKKGGRK